METLQKARKWGGGGSSPRPRSATLPHRGSSQTLSFKGVYRPHTGSSQTLSFRGVYGASVRYAQLVKSLARGQGWG